MSKQSSIVKIMTPARLSTYLGIRQDEQGKVMHGEDYFSIKIKSGVIVVVGGQKDGTVVDTVETNQKVRIYPEVLLNPERLPIIMGYNRVLEEYGAVSVPFVLPPKLGAEEYYLSFKADKKINIKDLDFVFQIYLLD